MDTMVSRREEVLARDKKRIALVFLGSSTKALSGGGGVERRFSMAFDKYVKCEGKQKFDLFLVTDEESYHELIKTGTLKGVTNVIKYKLAFPNSPFFLLFKYIRITTSLIRFVIEYEPNLIHLFRPSVQYIPFLFSLKFLPFLISKRKYKIADIKVAITVTDSELARRYIDKSRIKIFDIYKIFFKWVNLNGVFTYYKSFENLVKTNKILKKDTFVFCTTHGFTDTQKYFPSHIKKNIVIYAARHIAVKDPLFYLKALKILNETNPELYNKWEYYVYGQGPLMNVVKVFVNNNSLENVTLTYSADLSKPLSKSKIFVSSQDYENFPSMSMIEAMASGNAILARNMGQTGLFVRNRENGLLLDKDTPMDMASKLEELMLNPKILDMMGKKSRDITLKEHTIELFLHDLEYFWEKVLKHST